MGILWIILIGGWNRGGAPRLRTTHLPVPSVRAFWNCFWAQQTLICAAPISALGGEADMPFRTANVRFW